MRCSALHRIIIYEAWLIAWHTSQFSHTACISPPPRPISEPIITKLFDTICHQARGRKLHCTGGRIIKPCGHIIQYTRHPNGVSRRQADLSSAPATDTARDVWRTISYHYTVLFLSCDIKSSQYLPEVLTYRTHDFVLVMLWMWCYHKALWRHGDGVWCTAMIYTY